MSFSHKETVEIAKKGEGFLGSYYTATLLAAIGLTKYLVRYETRYSDDRTRLLTELVDEADVRPLPPATGYKNFQVSDRVDVYVNGAWWVGRITRKVDPNYHVRLDSNGVELHCPFYMVRIHLEWKDGNWVYHPNGPPTDDNQASTSKFDGSKVG